MPSSASGQGRRVRRVLLGVAILVPLLSLVLAESRFGRRLEKGIYDTWFTFRGELPRPEEIAIVAIDVDSEQSLGRYPWERKWHIKLIRNLARAGVKVVAFDATFADAFPDQDPAFMEAIEETGITILGAKTLTTVTRAALLRGLEEPTENLRRAPYGIVDVIPDPVDQVVREYPIVHYYRQGQVPQLGIQALKLYLDIPLSELVKVGPDGWQIGDISIPRGPGGGMLINYLGFRGSIATYSYAMVVDDAETDIGDWDMDAFEDLLAEGHLAGKMVFVGSTVPEHQDFWATTFVDEGGGGGAVLTSGVEIHANAVHTILKQRYIRVVPRLINYLFILLVGVGVTLLVSRLKARLGGIVGLAIIAFIGATGLILFLRYSSWIWVLSPTVAALLAYSGSTVALYLAEIQEKARIRGMFQQYVSTSVVNELIAHPELLSLGGEERELTVLFCDVADFTSISEGLSPTMLVSILNEYLTEMTDVVMEYSGIIDKYQGDALMAEFGAPVPFPDHALKCCMAALKMQSTLSDLRQRWEREEKPLLCSRVGINTGRMLVGNLGSLHIMDYTVMGDNVNLASRLEGANKVYGTNICISETTYDQLEGEMICRELDLIKVKGKQKPVRVFEVLETADMGIPAGRASLLERYEFALQLFREQQFGDALDLFHDILGLDPDDGPSIVYQERCYEYLKNPPPEDWDGVFVMQTK